MALQSGQKLGPYEIIGPLGAGGMGEVYEAKDTRLERAVAIKVLPEHLSDDENLRQRFEREAKTVSGLNHPNICTVYDVGHQDGVDFLVMELIVGETLAERLRNGPLPLAQALNVGLAVADALDKAHQRTIVHRDLKPGNVMLTKAGAKLLDFGLAKQQRTPGLDIASSSDRPTEAKALTREGSLLGTFEYMAPEQLQGGDVSPRTDIYALGLLLFEMVTGAKVFEGKSSAGLVAAIMSAEPPVPSSVAPDTSSASIPPALDAIILTCLAKDPEDRWQSAGDVARQLKWLAAGGSQPGSVAAPVVKRRALNTVLVALGALIAGAALSAIALSTRGAVAPTSTAVTEFSITPGTSERFRGSMAISRDGRTLVYVAFIDGVAHSFRRSMDSVDAVRIPGTEAGASLTISPDGEWLAFRDGDDGMLKKVSLSGGAPVTLAPAFSFGSDWGDYGNVVYTGDGFTVWRVSEAGGAPENITELGDGDIGHFEAQWLPGERGLVFTAAYRDQAPMIELWDMETGARQPLFPGRSPRWATTGHILFRVDESLWAAPFDTRRLEVTGEPVPVLQGVAFNNAGFTYYAMARDGTLALMPGSGIVASELVWVDEDGHATPMFDDSDVHSFPRLSPDEQFVAVATRGSTGADFWVYDIERGSKTKLTVDAGSAVPVAAWMLDGRRIVFNSRNEMYSVAADGTGDAELLADVGSGTITGTLSPDGRYLAFERVGTDGSFDLGVVPLEGDEAPEGVLSSSFQETAPAYSPDGGLIAYVSNESGRNEVYVRSFPGAARQWVVSNGGGREPVWSPDGSKLYYRNGGEMWAVAVELEPDFRPGKPVLLFDQPFGVRTALTSTTPNYDVASDGRFLMLRRVESDGMREIRVVLNWFSELERLVPTQ